MNLRTLAPVILLAGAVSAALPAQAGVQRTVMVEEFGWIS
jgi:hypothetical protein